MQKNYFIGGYGSEFSNEAIAQINEDFAEYIHLVKQENGNVTIRSPYGTEAYGLLDKTTDYRRPRLSIYSSDGTLINSFFDYLSNLSLSIMTYKHGISIGYIGGSTNPPVGTPVHMTWITNHLRKKYTIFGTENFSGNEYGIKLENGEGDVKLLFKATKYSSQSSYLTTAISTASAVQCARLFDGDEFIEDVYLAMIAPPVASGNYEVLNMDGIPYALVRHDTAGSSSGGDDNYGPRFIFELQPEEEEE